MDIDKEITKTQLPSKDYIWYLNLLNFDVDFNENEKELLNEDCDKMVIGLEAWKKNLIKLKRDINA